MVWKTSRFILKQLDYSLSISIRDSWLGLRPRQLSRDRNLKLIIKLFSNLAGNFILCSFEFPFHNGLNKGFVCSFLYDKEEGRIHHVLPLHTGHPYAHSTLSNHQTSLCFFLEYHLRLQFPSASSSCPEGHVILGHLKNPTVFSHSVPRGHECCPLEHSSISRHSKQCGSQLTEIRSILASPQALRNLAGRLDGRRVALESMRGRWNVKMNWLYSQ